VEVEDEEMDKMEMEDEMEVVEGMGMGLSELIIQVLQQIITPHPTRTRPISGMGSGTLVEVHTPLSYTVRRNSSTRPRDRWSASTFSSVAIHVQVITKPNLIMSASSSRRRSFRRCALDRPLAPDFWKLELSMKNCTTQPRHLCASRSTHATTVSPSRKSIGRRAARLPYLNQS